jgi:hypothetical protein
MDQKTQDALAKLGKPVEPGTKPTSEAMMPSSPEHESVEETLKTIQEEQAQDPKKFAPALKEVEPPEEDKQPTEEPKAAPETTSEDVNNAQQLISEHLTAEPDSIYCQKCGWDINKGVILPTEDEVKEFVRSLYGDRGFQKEYELFGNGMKVTFKEITSTQKDKLTSILKTIKPEGGNRVYLEVISDMRKIQTLATLSKLSTEDQETKFDIDLDKFETAEDMLQEFEKQLGSKFPALGVDILLRGYIEFSRLLNILTEAAFDENFWEGAGLESLQKPTA